MLAENVSDCGRLYWSERSDSGFSQADIGSCFNRVPFELDSCSYAAHCRRSPLSNRASAIRFANFLDKGLLRSPRFGHGAPEAHLGRTGFQTMPLCGEEGVAIRARPRYPQVSRFSDSRTYPSVRFPRAGQAVLRLHRARGPGGWPSQSPRYASSECIANRSLFGIARTYQLDARSRARSSFSS